jgi:Peptidase M50B-like
VPVLGPAPLAAPAVADPSSLAWTAAALAWLLAVPLFFVTRYALVVAHEGGHALAAKFLFRAVRITFDRGGGGGTDVGKPPWLFDIVITLAGYLGPSVFGLIAAGLLTQGHTVPVLWASLALLLVMLLAVRGWVGWLVVPGLIILIFVLATRVQPPLQTLFTYVWVWFLLIAAVERMIIFMQQKAYNDATSDAGVLRRLTRLPAPLWALVFLAGTVTALVYGGAMLLRLHG